MSVIRPVHNQLRTYRRRNFNWQPLFDRLDNNESQTAVAASYDVPQQTLSRHYAKYRRGRENGNSRLIDEAVGRPDGRKRSHRTLNEAEEQEIYRHYQSAIKRRKGITGGTLAETALRVYSKYHPHWTRSAGRHRFTAKSDWRTRFLKDHNITRKIVRKRHRPNSYPTEDELLGATAAFHQRTQCALETYPLKMIINMDETSLKVVTPPRVALCDKGKGPAIVYHKTKVKTAVTMVVGITASGSKLRPTLLAKGKTSRSLIKFALPKSIDSILCKKGWMDGSVMIEWINRILIPYADGAGCALIVDDLPAHQTPAIKAHCEKNNIELILVPGWLTGTLQPLDVSVFGKLKSIMIQEWTLAMLSGDDYADTLAGLMRRFVSAFRNIHRHDVRKAFALAGISYNTQKQTK